MVDKKRLKEADVTPEILQAMEASGCHLFRNNRGVAKFGQRWVRYGVGSNGAGDFIGFLPVRVTEAMVGHFLPVFLSVETKRPVGAEYAPEQRQWIKTIASAGGITGFVRSWEDGRKLVTDWFKRFEKKP